VQVQITDVDVRISSYGKGIELCGLGLIGSVGKQTRLSFLFGSRTERDLSFMQASAHGRDVTRPDNIARHGAPQFLR
jgi:hypothetical protein